MSSSVTTKLDLFKPVPGTSEPFRADDFNDNMDKIDAEAIDVDERLTALESTDTDYDERLDALETTIDGGTP
jgi:hypothetical protein